MHLYYTYNEDKDILQENLNKLMEIAIDQSIFLAEVNRHAATSFWDIIERPNVHEVTVPTLEELSHSASGCVRVLKILKNEKVTLTVLNLENPSQGRIRKYFKNK